MAEGNLTSVGQYEVQDLLGAVDFIKSLIHDEADTNVPVENSELLRAEYPEAQFLRVPGAKNLKAFATGGDNYLREVFNFLDNI